MSRFILYLPLLIAAAFILAALYLSPTMEKYNFAPKYPIEIFLIIFAGISLLDVFYFSPKLMREKVMPSTSEEELGTEALTVLSISIMPALFGFIVYFLSGSWLYFGAFMALGILSWLYFSRKIENKWKEVQQ